MKFLLRVLGTAAAVWVAAWLIPGIVVSGQTGTDTAVTLLVVALVIGLVNAFVKPVATLLSSCLIVLTFGLFLLVVNAAMLLLSAWVCQQLGIGFSVDGWGPALFGSLVISIVSGVINGLTGASTEQ